MLSWLTPNISVSRAEALASLCALPCPGCEHSYYYYYYYFLFASSTHVPFLTGILGCLLLLLLQGPRMPPSPSRISLHKHSLSSMQCIPRYDSLGPSTSGFHFLNKSQTGSRLNERANRIETERNETRQKGKAKSVKKRRTGHGPACASRVTHQLVLLPSNPLHPCPFALSPFAFGVFLGLSLIPLFHQRRPSIHSSAKGWRCCHS
ncbi:hypothetical protein J3F83DRAFT_722716 [Trichoderma novae-zelandiae]